MSLEQWLRQICQSGVHSGVTRQGGPAKRVVIGLNGPVGAGKSSLARRLQAELHGQGLRVAVASIDDAYAPYGDRLARLSGNPYGVTRVPPGSHNPDWLLDPIRRWRSGAPDLQLPRFDKRLRGGDGDPAPPWQGAADVLVLEGWLVGCRPLQASDLDAWTSDSSRAALTSSERQWQQRCDHALMAYVPLWDELDELVMLWPLRWRDPYRWRFQAEARQRRSGGGWMQPDALRRMIQASLESLPPPLYQRPLLHKAGWVRLLDSRRRVQWEGPGPEAAAVLDQAQA